MEASLRALHTFTPEDLELHPRVVLEPAPPAPAPAVATPAAAAPAAQVSETQRDGEGDTVGETARETQ